MGKQFSTGNSTVAKLKVGAILEVVGPGTLEIVDGGDFVPGDRVSSKYGPATVVRITNRNSLDEVFADAAGDAVVYIADGTNVVRIASTDQLSSL